jgi:hypothetical protein
MVDSEELQLVGNIRLGPPARIISIQRLATMPWGRTYHGGGDAIGTSAFKICWGEIVFLTAREDARFFVFVNGRFAGAFDGRGGIVHVRSADQFYVEVVEGHVTNTPEEMMALLTGFEGDRAEISFERPQWNIGAPAAPLQFVGNVP